MLNISTQPNGDLLIQAGNDTRQTIKELQTKGDYWSCIWCDLIEDYACNGSYTFFDASEGNPNVGLTSAPCIAESMDVLDDGRCLVEGDFWYYDMYQIRNELDVLKNTGRVVFTLCGEG